MLTCEHTCDQSHLAAASPSTVEDASLEARVLCSKFRFFCCLVAKSRLTLCDPMYYSTPGFPVPRYLPEFAQTHVHWVSDAIQPSHPLSPLPLPSTSLSGRQSYLAKITSSLCPASLCLNTVPSFMLMLGSWNRIFYCIPSVIYYFLKVLIWRFLNEPMVIDCKLGKLSSLCLFPLILIKL